MGSKSISLIMILIICLSVFSNVSQFNAHGDLIDPASLVIHNTIQIIGDSQFTGVNGVSTGDGSESDPYVIENFSIDATTAHGIYIENTDSYFVINNCYIFNGTNQGSSNYGIYLKYVNNGTIKNNRLTAVYRGVYLYYSENINVTNNTIKAVDPGIEIFEGRSHKITNNTIFTSVMGITLFRTDENYVFNNEVTCTKVQESYYGLEIRRSTGNVLRSNNITGFDIAGVFMDDSHKNEIDNNYISDSKNGFEFFLAVSQNNITNSTVNDYIDYGFNFGNNPHQTWGNKIDPTNIVNGDPFYFFYDKHGTSSEPVIIENLTLKSRNVSSLGRITLIESSNILIRNCSIQGENTYGIYLKNSDNISISLNKIKDARTGIDAYGSKDIKITNNTITNTTLGVSQSSSENIYISFNSILKNNWGVYSSYSTNNIIINNNISENNIGINLEISYENVIKNNIILNNVDYGFSYYPGDHPLIENNTILDSGEYDFKIYSMINISIVDTYFRTGYIDTSGGKYSSTLTVKNHVSLKVTDTDGTTPLPGADIIVKEDDNKIYSSTGYGGTDPKTDNNGLSPDILVIDRVYYEDEDDPRGRVTSINVKSGGWEDIRRYVNMIKPHAEYFQKGEVTPNIPDFSLVNEDIQFSDDEILEGETIVISGNVFNYGNADRDVIVSFYDGPPVNGLLIGNDSISVPVGLTNTAFVEWDATMGNHTIWIVVDEHDLVPESDENNNIAYGDVDVNKNWGNVEWLNTIPGGNQIYSVAWKPDGIYALIAGEGGTITKYDGVNFIPVPSSTILGGPMDISWKPDGSYALIVGWEGPVLKYDGERIIVLSSKWKNSHSVDWKPDGSYALITCGNVILKYDGRSFTVLKNFEPFDTYATNVLSWHPDGSYALITRYDYFTGMCELYKFDGMKFTRLFMDQYDLISTISWHPDGDYAILTGTILDSGRSIDFTASVWKFDGINNDLIYSNNSLDYFNNACWEPNGNYSLITGSSGALLKYDGQNFIDLTNQTFYASHLLAASWRPNSNTALIAGSVGYIFQYENLTIKEISRDIFGSRSSFSSGFTKVSWKNNDQTAYILGSHVYEGKLVKFKDNKLSLLTNDSLPRYPGDIAWKPDNSYALITGWGDKTDDGKILKFNGTNFSEISSSGSLDDIHAVGWKPDGSYAILVGYDGAIIKYDGSTFNKLAGTNGVYYKDIEWAPDGSYALICGYFSSNSTGIVVKYEKTQITTIFADPDHWLISISWKPDGSYALITGDSRIFKYDGLVFTELAPPKMENGFYCVSWKPDGSYALIAGNGWDEDIFVFDGNEFFKLPFDFQDTLYDVSWNPDDSSAIIVGDTRAILKFTPGLAKLKIPPTAILTADISNGETDEVITFDATGSTDDISISSYYFDFGDGETTTWIPDPIVKHSYSVPGNYTASLKVKNTNGLLNTNEATFDISISQAYSPPLVSIIYPNQNENVNGTIMISGTAVPVIGKIQSVEIGIDDDTWKTAEGSINWSYSWNTTTVFNGVHEIYARAYDGVNFSLVETLTVIVNNSISDIDEDLDMDDDGIFDKWEEKYGLDPTDPRDALEDWDSDGYSNLDEFLAGTDPLNADDVPEINLLPVADAGKNKTVTIGETLIFNGSGSFDPDGQVLNYTWDFDDGSYCYGLEVTHEYTKIGKYTVTLKVTDNRMGMDQDSLIVIVEVIDDDKDKNKNEGMSELITYFSIVIIILLLIGALFLIKRSRIRVEGTEELKMGEDEAESEETEE